MTWSTTHLGISTLLLYTFSPKSLKEEFKSNPRLFFFISLGAIAPDFDLIIQTMVLSLPDFFIFNPLQEFFRGTHRVWSHTVFLPLLIMLLAGPLSKLKPSKINLQRNVRLFGFMWLTHLLFDLTFGPLALFYPLDTRFYNVFFGITVGLEGNSFIPLTLNGFYSDVQFIGQETGSSSFFVNWTPEQRITFFNSDVTKINILNFWLHVMIFFYYFITVIIPFIIFEKRNLSNYSLNYTSKRLSGLFTRLSSLLIYLDTQLNSINERIRRLYKKQNGWNVQIILLLLIISSYYAGPHHGETWEDNRTEGDVFYALSDGLQFFSVRVFEVPDDSEFTVNVSYGDGDLPISVFSMPIDLELGIQIRDEFNIKLQSFGDGNISYSELLNQYDLLVNQYIAVNNIQNLNSTYFPSWEFQSTKDMAIISGFYNWDPNFFFIRSVQYKLNWQLPRHDTYRNGIYLVILFSFILSVSLVKFRRNVDKTPLEDQ